MRNLPSSLIAWNLLTVAALAPTVGLLSSCHPPDPRDLTRRGEPNPPSDDGGPVPEQASEYSMTLLPTEGAPSPRLGYAIFSLAEGGAAIVAGYDASGDLRDGAIIDPTLATWSSVVLPDELPPRFMAKGVALDAGYFFLWGGVRYQNVTKSRGERLGDGGIHSEKDGWDPVFPYRSEASGEPTIRSGHCVAAFADEAGWHVIIWGGENQGTYLSDGGVFHASSGVWTKIPQSSGPSPREEHYCEYSAALGGMVVHGGLGPSGVLADTWLFMPGDGSWRRIDTEPPAPPRYAPCAALDPDGRLFVYGGSAPEARTDGILLDLARGTSQTFLSAGGGADLPGECEGGSAVSGRGMAYSPSIGWVFPAVGSVEDGRRRRVAWRAALGSSGVVATRIDAELDPASIGRSAVALQDGSVLLWGGGDPNNLQDMNSAGVVIQKDQTAAK